MIACGECFPLGLVLDISQAVGMGDIETHLVCACVCHISSFRKKYKFKYIIVVTANDEIILYAL
jgi:hypothetical protein